MKGIKSEKQNSVMHTVFNREPMKLLRNRSEVIYGRTSGNDTGSGMKIKYYCAQTVLSQMLSV